MSNTTTFTIDGKTFSCLSDLHTMNEFQVRSSPKDYRVSWQDDESPFKRINAILSENQNNYLLIDETILTLYGSELKADPKQIFSASATETFKTLDGVTTVLDNLYERGFTKGETLVVVGGGIIQDVGAFVGACYKRGITWIYFPTTLLSMCDSCIGGKTGINYKKAKNQLALFSSPTEVVINPLFLKTLSNDLIRSGLGEILKLFVTGGSHFLSQYKAVVKNGEVQNFADFKLLILSALSIKRAIVEEDEFEFNHRRSLNYGHTFGHVVEVLSDYRIPHGIAVVIGMIVVNELSDQNHLINQQSKWEIGKLCLDLLSSEVVEQVRQLALDDVLNLLTKDKKTESQMATFVMIKTAGETCFVKIKINETLFKHIDESIKRVFN